MIWPTDPSETGLAWAMPPCSPGQARMEALTLLRECEAEHGPFVSDLVGRCVAEGAEGVHALSGRAYELGFGEDEARSWLRLAACLGSPSANAEMGVLCAAIGAARDPGEAEGWRGLSRRWAELASGPGSKPCGPALFGKGDEVGLPAHGDVRRDLLVRWPWAEVAADAAEAAVSVARMSGKGTDGLPHVAFVTCGASEAEDLVPWLRTRMGLRDEAGTRISLDGTPAPSPGAVRVEIPRPRGVHARRVAENAIGRHCRRNGLSAIDLPVRPDSLSDMVLQGLLEGGGRPIGADRILEGLLARFQGGKKRACTLQ